MCVSVFMFVWALIHIQNSLSILDGKSCWLRAFHLFIFLYACLSL